MLSPLGIEFVNEGVDIVLGGFVFAFLVVFGEDVKFGL